MAICVSSAQEGLVGGLIGVEDCYIRELVQESYRNLVGPNTLFAAALTGLLTIYIALLGYQVLFGRGGVRITDLPVTALKIGLILAFLTSWAAYQTVVFNLLFDGPREILRALLAPLTRLGLGFDGDVYGGLEHAYARLSAAAQLYGAQASSAANILQGGPMLASGILWMSSIVMLLSTIGVILAVKIILAFLLAIGPVFIGLFLFEPTRGLFDGWLRTTIGFALAPLAANVFGAVMLLMLRPFLNELEANTTQQVFDMGVVITLGLIVAIFVLIMIMALRMGAGLAAGLSTSSPGRRPERTSPDGPIATPARNDRAEQIAAQFTLTDQAPANSSAAETRRIFTSAGAASEIVPVSQRLGQTYRRLPTPGPVAMETGR